MQGLDALPPEIQKRIKEWLSEDIDKETKSTILNLLNSNPQAIADAFSSTLAFGTGGMRGLMGVGTCRMNIYTIRLATQGLSNYLSKQPKELDHHSVLIGYDSRHHSEQFAQEAARVLAGNGIGVFLLKEIRPTPYVSFGVRQKKCTAGIMITASHNPKEYNGYKVYWSDGGQVVSPHDIGIVDEVQHIQTMKAIKLAPLTHPLIQMVDLSLDLDYLAAIHPLSINPQENHRVGNGLKITYTSLHGTGIKLVPRALKEWGFTNVNLVGAQVVPDGNFPTVASPNPENPKTLALGIEQLTQSGSDILIATDPDADRMAVVALHHQKPFIFTGNEIAVMFMEYLCQSLSSQKKLSPHSAFVTTIVSSDLIKIIANQYDCPCFKVLTGFKYIGEKIHEWELSKAYHFIFGAEESYGYLLGTHSRDKDAVIASCLIAEVALLMKVEGRTLVDFLYEIYKKYGIFQEKQLTLDFPPNQEGMKKMQALMEKWRQKPHQEILGKKVIIFEDYLKQERKDFNTKKTSPLTLPKSDVLLYRLDDESKIVIRPSGTEPKLKAYVAIREKKFSSIDEGIKSCAKRLDSLINDLKQMLSS